MVNKSKTMKLSQSQIDQINSTSVRGVNLEFLSQDDKKITVKWRIFSLTTIRSLYVTGRIESLEDVISRLEHKVNFKWNEHFTKARV